MKEKFKPEMKRKENTLKKGMYVCKRYERQARKAVAMDGGRSGLKREPHLLICAA